MMIQPDKDRPGMGYWTILVVGCYVGLAPFFGAPPNGSAYDRKRVIQVAALILINVGVLVWPTARASVQRVWNTLTPITRRSVGLILLLGLVSSLTAEDPLLALLEMSVLTMSATTAVSIASAVLAAPGSATGLLVGFTYAGAAAYSVAFIADYLFSTMGLSHAFRGTPYALWPNGEFLGFVHVRFFNQIQSAFLPLLVIPFLKRGSRWMSADVVLLFVPGIWWALVFASGSRGTLVSCVVALALTFLLYRRNVASYIVANLFVFATGLLLFLFLFKILGESTGTIDGRSLTYASERTNLWLHAWSLIKSHPILGVGPMHYAMIHHYWGAHPHNSVLQLASEWGLPAALLATGTVIFGTLRLIRKEISADGMPHKIAPVTALFAGLIHSLLSGIMVMPTSQMAMTLVAGWCVGVSLQRDRKARSVPRPATAPGWVGPIWATVLVASIVLTVVGATRSYGELDARMSTAKTSGIDHRVLPRFWEYGCISSHRPTAASSGPSGS